MMAVPYQRKAVLLAAQTARLSRKTSPMFNGFNSCLRFSSTTPDTDQEPPNKPHPQSFVDPNIELQLGELSDLPPNFHQNQKQGPHPESRARYSRHAWDGRDSYWRPPWTSRAEIISAEDLANMPKVTFSEEFESMADGMITLSWLTDAQASQMYQFYVDLMTAFVAKSKDKNKDPRDKEWGVLTANTSHEYVVRVVAQKYNVTTSRAAGVIQLKHNEEQLKKDPDFFVDHKLQAHVDNKIRQTISEVYRSYGEKDPLEFVEDPIASTGILGHEGTGSPGIEKVSDLIDVDALAERKRKQERAESIRRMRTHMYVEDVDDNTVNVRLDKEARRYLKSSEKLRGLYSNEVKEAVDQESETNEDDELPSIDALPESGKLRTKVPKIPEYATPYPENNAGYKGQAKQRRPRWKYAAQIIDTRALENPPNSDHGGKKVAARIKSKRHGRVVEGNTLIEQGGKVRVATRAEVEQTSWKHIRNESEFMFKGVKQAWIQRQIHGEVGGWGFQEEVNAPEPEVKEEEETSSEGESEESSAEDGANEGDESESEKKV